MSLYTGNNIIITEFIDNVFNIQLGSAASLCSLFQTVQLLCLSAVYADADNFIVKILLQPGNDSGSIQTAETPAAARKLRREIFFMIKSSVL